MKRSKFSLSHTRLLSCDMGELVPVGLVEVLPGDTLQHACNLLVRASPLLAPVMHPVDVRIHHWYVPHRLVFDTFEDFITGGADGEDATTPPYFSNPTFAVGSLGDYFGLPTGVALSDGISALPFRGYASIWNEYYRDQDLQTALVVDTTDGQDTTTSTVLQNCGWEKDYFTSSRPWEQKGPGITIPIGSSAPVTRVSNASGWLVKDHGTNTDAAANLTGGTTSTAGQLGRATTATRWSLDPNGGLIADLSGASAVTVTALREALALQRFEEARARYGSRYVEYLRYLGVRSSDARLQRPEYLGGGRQTIQFSEVLQTAEGANPVGQLRGHGVAATRSNRYRRFFEEHGFVMSLMSVKPRTMYMNGVSRQWSRWTKEKYWQAELQHIGQQEVLKQEVYAAAASPTAVFGYQDRYDEYRRMESGISGEFRTTLNHWHFARSFGSEPSLNADFVKCVPPETPFAVPATDVLWVMARHSIQARRMVAGSGRSFIF